MTISAPTLDIIAALAGVEADSPLATLRAQRPESVQHAQGSYAALFDPAESVGLAPGERFAVARHVAQLHAAEAAEQHYAARLAAVGEPSPSPRLSALLAHAELLSQRPAAARPADLQALADAGLFTREIVTLSQIIAFVAFQVRVIAGLRLLGPTAPAQPSTSSAAGSSAEAASGPSAAPPATSPSAPASASTGGQPAARVIQPPADLRRPTVFTIEQLEWTPWLQPLDLANASPKQAAALEGTRGNSPYFRLLAEDIDVLVERTATDRGIFYTPGGAPRADRELSAAATSRLNGCIYCTSVHARLASQLSKRTDDIQRLLDRGVAPGTSLELDPRWQAIVDLAVALAPSPPRAQPAHIARLRELGLGDLELLDVIQASSFFAWANRLMLTLGEPYLPTTATP